MGALGCWNVAGILASGTTNLRTGASYRRSKSPGMFWASACALVLQLGIGAFLVAAGLGAPTWVVFVTAIGVMALVLVGLVVR